MSDDFESSYPTVSESIYSYSNETLSGNWLFIFTGSLYFLVSVIGLIGNGTVIYVILRFAKMKTVTNIYILNLALADNLFLIALIFLAVATIHPQWLFGKVLCHLVFGIDALNLFTSIFCLTLMAIDRYVAVCFAVKASYYRNMRVATIINVSVWILALAAASPIMVFTRYKEEHLSCGIDISSIVGPDATAAVSKAFSFYMFIFGFVIPITVIAACYIMIIVRLHKMGNKTGKWEKSRKVNRLVLCVIMVFVVCWSPFFLYRVVASFHMSARTLFFFNELTICLSYMNSCANPFLYGFLSDSFKKSYKKAWHCGDVKGYELTSTAGDARPWKLRNPCLGQEQKNTRLRTGHGNDDDTVSGGRLNAYPLTAVTSAVSEITMHQKNGEPMGSPSYA